jgi:hypothetical protein
MQPYLEGIADWLRHEFYVEDGPLPSEIDLMLARLRRAEAQDCR